MLQVQHNVSLKNKTTLRLGGITPYYVKIKSKQDLLDFAEFEDTLKIPFKILGGGSNLLIADESMCRELPFGVLDIDITDELIPAPFAAEEKDMLPPLVLNYLEKKHRNFVKLHVGAGSKIPALLQYCKENGLTGLEGLVGIPCRAGGTIAMNAGAYRTEINDVLLRVELFHKKYGIINLTRENMRLNYRKAEFTYNNALLQDYIITGADFIFPVIDKKIVKETLKDVVKEIMKDTIKDTAKQADTISVKDVQKEFKTANVEVTESLRGEHNAKAEIKAQTVNLAETDKNLQNNLNQKEMMMVKNNAEENFSTSQNDKGNNFNYFLKSSAEVQSKYDTAQSKETQAPYNMKEPRDIERLVRTMQSSVSKGQSKLTVVLTPENLGRMQIQLSESGGKITAKFLSDNESSHKLIMAQRDLLKNQLSEKGIVVDNMEFAFNDAMSKQQNNDEHGRKTSKQNQKGKNFRNQEDNLEVGTEVANNKPTGIYA